MKRFRILALILFASSVAFLPQHGLSQPTPEPVPEKTTVVLDYFSCSPEVPVMYMEAVRSGVMACFIERGRHNMIDAESVSPPPAANVSINTGNPVAILNTQQRIEEAHQEAIRNLNTRFVVTGNVTHYAIKRDIVSGKPTYTSTFVFVLAGYDTLTGEPLETREFRLIGRGDIPGKADQSAIENMRTSVVFYLDANFKFTTEILRIEAPNKKGKYKELYIHCGSSIGVQNGDLFKVYLNTDIGGVPVQKQIGKLRAVEAMNGEITRCNIQSGGEEIASAFAEGLPMTVISDSQALF